MIYVKIAWIEIIQFHECNSISNIYLKHILIDYILKGLNPI